MTQEDKLLFLTDLCARLPYNVIVQYKGHNNIIKNKLLTGSDLDCNMEYYKPYLRPMLSMTEVENKRFDDILTKMYYHEKSTLGDISDYLNSIHVDYRGLIEKGLAIAVNESNNPYK